MSFGIFTTIYVVDLRTFYLKMDYQPPLNNDLCSLYTLDKT